MKKLRIFLLFALAVIAVGIVIVTAIDPYRIRQRRAWKNWAIADIAQRTDDPKWLASEIGRLKKQGGSDPEFPETWLSKHLVLMRNGEWITYANICRKEDGRIDDLFIGKGSDGR